MPMRRRLARAVTVAAPPQRSPALTTTRRRTGTGSTSDAAASRRRRRRRPRSRPAPARAGHPPSSESPRARFPATFRVDPSQAALARPGAARRLCARRTAAARCGRAGAPGGAAGKPSLGGLAHRASRERSGAAAGPIYPQPPASTGPARPGPGRTDNRVLGAGPASMHGRVRPDRRGRIPHYCAHGSGPGVTTCACRPGRGDSPGMR
jgi:hypothetical protein